MRSTKSGFTLIEVMLAVAVLALVGTASLKLVALSQNGLRAAKENREFIAIAEKLRTDILTGEATENGSEKNISWRTVTGEKKFFGTNFGKLDFDAKQNKAASDNSFKWRELEISDSVKNRKIKIVMPVLTGE